MNQKINDLGSPELLEAGPGSGEPIEIMVIRSCKEPGSAPVSPKYMILVAVRLGSG